MHLIFLNLNPEINQQDWLLVKHVEVECNITLESNCYLNLNQNHEGGMVPNSFENHTLQFEVNGQNFPQQPERLHSSHFVIGDTFICSRWLISNINHCANQS
jgi:hypothetical protein